MTKLFSYLNRPLYVLLAPLLLCSCTTSIDSNKFLFSDYLKSCDSVQQDTLVLNQFDNGRYEVSIPVNWPILHDSGESDGLYFGDTVLLNNGIVFTIGITELPVKTKLEPYFNSEVTQFRNDPNVSIDSFGDSKLNNSLSKWIVISEKYDEGINKNLLLYFSDSDHAKLYLLHFTTSDSIIPFEAQVCSILPVIKSFKIQRD